MTRTTTRTTLAAIAATLALTVAAPLYAPQLDANRAGAQETVAGAMTIEHPWARINIGDRPSAGFMKITNAGEADRLVDARSEAYGRIELHTHTMVDGAMQMRQVEAIDVPGEGAVDLAPGGLHVMLFDPQQKFAEGDMVPLTLVFEKAGAVDVMLMAQGLASGAPKHGEHQNHGATD